MKFSHTRASHIFDDISAERVRQDSLRDMGKFPFTLADKDVQLDPWHAIPPLGEEFGEVCRAVCENDSVNLREELIQLAACCVAWVECIDAADMQFAHTWRPEPTAADYAHDDRAPKGAD